MNVLVGVSDFMSFRWNNKDHSPFPSVSYFDNRLYFIVQLKEFNITPTQRVKIRL
jgi:hypothetical protein